MTTRPVMIQTPATMRCLTFICAFPNPEATTGAGRWGAGKGGRPPGELPGLLLWRLNAETLSEPGEMEVD